MSVLSDIMRGAASRSGAAVERLLQQEENKLQREHELTEQARQERVAAQQGHEQWRREAMLEAFQTGRASIDDVEASGFFTPRDMALFRITGQANKPIPEVLGDPSTTGNVITQDPVTGEVGQSGITGFEIDPADVVVEDGQHLTIDEQGNPIYVDIHGVRMFNEWEQVKDAAGLFQRTDAKTGDLEWMEYEGTLPVDPEGSGSIPENLQLFHKERQRVIDAAAKGEMGYSPEQAKKMIDAASAAYGVPYGEALKRVDDQIIDASLTVVEVGEGMLKTQAQALSQRMRAVTLLDYLKDPKVRASMGTGGVTSHRINRWMERAGMLAADQRSNSNVYVDREVEEFLTLLGLGRDTIVRIRSGAAVPPSEDEKFKMIIGSEWDHPEHLRSRLRGVIMDTNESAMSVHRTLGRHKFGADNVPENWMRSADVHLFNEDIATRHGQLLDVAKENDGVLPSQYVGEWNRLKKLMEERNLQ
jgi:hypothetical protein